MSKKSFFMLCCAIVMILPLAGCASSRDQASAYKAPTEISDPLEPVNRAIFGFNNAVDIVLFEPVSKVYRFIIPSPVRDSVQNFMRNLRTPMDLAHNVLQGELGDAGVSAGRFLINTTVGIGGLFDVAARQGLEYEREDLGQTLGKWGVGHGFYLVLPILGPSSLRDGIAMVGDTYADPLRIYAFAQDDEWIFYTRNGIEALDNRARLIDAVADLRRNSQDYYAVVRSIYGQQRYGLVHDDPYSHLNEADDAYDY